MELSVGEIQLKDYRHFVGFVRDLTQREENEKMLHEMQSEMFHMSRLSTMGEMASALAHERNQPLAAISNYLQGSRRLIESIDNERAALLRSALNKATEQALRAGEVIQRLRSFVSRGETEKRIESLSKIIEETSALALVAAKEQSIRVNLQFGASSDRVLADKIQIQQVLLNLMRNAAESMQTSSHRQLTVSTQGPSEGLVAIRVADTGSGIKPETMEKLFQPFFTTKKQGMGVGISICRTIVESHGGKITVEPNPDGGTIFCFTMRGVTKEVQLPARLAGPAKDPWGNLRIGLEAKMKLNRKDYGINYHEVLEAGALAVGEEVKIEIDAEAIKADYLDEVDKFRAKYRNDCVRARIDYVPLHTGMPFDKALMSYLLTRQHRA
jgi:two-component system sensor kinase FixL